MISLEANDDSPLLNGMCDDTCHGILNTAVVVSESGNVLPSKGKEALSGIIGKSFKPILKEVAGC